VLDETGEAPALLRFRLAPGAVKNAPLAGLFRLGFHLDHLRVMV
jgi:hypothetical protein